MEIVCKTKIAILLATYNGAKYLQQQIDSLLNQTFKDWTLYICDDGSTDNTLNIIEENVSRHNNIILIQKTIDSHGACQNFMNMLKNISSQYYMFCDQDDIWLPTKIELCYSRLKNVEFKNPEKPICICTDLTLVDNKLNILYLSMWDYSKLKPRYLSRLKYLQTCNILTGCTMLFNRRAKEVSLLEFDSALMHDSWIGLQVAAKGGEIICIEESTILYRQHSSNVLGAPHSVNYYYYYLRLHHLLEVLKKTRSQFKYVRKIKKTSFASFIWHKFCYSFLRLL